MQWGDAPSWPKLAAHNVPTQNNGSDCGVFAIKFAECIGTGRCVRGIMRPRACLCGCGCVQYLGSDCVLYAKPKLCH